MASYPRVTDVTMSSIGIAAPDWYDPAADGDLSYQETRDRTNRWRRQAIERYYPTAPDGEREALRMWYESSGGNLDELRMRDAAGGSGDDGGSDAPYTDDGDGGGGYENPYLSGDDGRQGALASGGVPWLLIAGAGAAVVGVVFLVRAS